ncbi:hypothetical protein RHSIM_Rhsim02G0005600 [Rhododendron simsii]|uniref:Extradiol ring-cleavage dioxygenase class III enzyme subunit B domain-containing protein n=1 Tax=Rhododendron simsii TaxID=118357 RepID=A0A834HKZ8_RHOSS|nr:hypothetical protein RHSIM_Rhsim02G0005600 [Rhododendron simsii]
MAQAKVKETYYISHGSPTLSIDDSLPARGFLKSFRDTVYGGAQRPPPTSILVISGHWETDYPTVNAVSGTCDTIYDFYGFPQEMYKLKYPAPGAPQLATRVKELLTASGFQRVSVDKKRGLDHGAWVPLMLMFPEADIPVCQLSIQTNRDGTYHYNLGKALAPLKEEGVLIIGSGSATHNLRALRQSRDGSVASWALEFDTWLKDALLNGRSEGDLSTAFNSNTRANLIKYIRVGYETHGIMRRWEMLNKSLKQIQTVEATLVLLQAKAVEERKVQVKSGKGERERLFILGKAKVKETYYISHGSPTLSIDDSLPARGFLKSFRDTVYGGVQRPPPTSILIISGHWETNYPAVNAISGTCDTIYDFYNFPQEMYKLKYPAPGAPELATRVKELLMASGYQKVSVDKKRGLDHGAWVPLMLMFPEADIPVCQLSVQTNRDGTYHYNLGKALAPLKEEGVLIIGSGSAVHNLRALSLSGDGSVAAWALEFDTWLKDALLDGRYEDVNHYEERAPHAKAAHPRPDHFYPLHVAIGAAGENAKAELIHNSWQLGTLSYASYKFTPTE